MKTLRIVSWCLGLLFISVCSSAAVQENNIGPDIPGSVKYVLIYHVPDDREVANGFGELAVEAAAWDKLTIKRSRTILALTDVVNKSTYTRFIAPSGAPEDEKEPWNNLRWVFVFALNNGQHISLDIDSAEEVLIEGRDVYRLPDGWMDKILRVVPCIDRYE